MQNVLEKKRTAEIRLATPADAPQISSLLNESFAEYRPQYTEGGFAATTPTTDQVRHRMQEGPIWIAEQDGHVVGTVSVVSQGEELYIRGMAVAPSARGSGLGELLLSEIERFALDGSYRRLTLSTTPFLLRAIRLYEHHGFQRTEAQPHDLFGTPLFTMVKNLSSVNSRS
jgi:ribosomal protein S18 acetylase RimI-like enzyme